VLTTLESVAGVESVEVDFANKTACVVPADGFDSAAAISALKENNYGATIAD
jgi:copper chaperone CopZ